MNSAPRPPRNGNRHRRTPNANCHNRWRARAARRSRERAERHTTTTIIMTNRVGGARPHDVVVMRVCPTTSSGCAR